MTLTKMWVPIILYCSNCIKFDQLVLRKIIKIVATRCQILRLKCTKFNFGWGSAPDPARRAYSASPDPLAGFRALLLRGGEERGGKGKGKRKGRKGKERKGNGREGEGRCASSCVVECRICNREVAGSTLGRGYFVSRSTRAPVNTLPQQPLGLRSASWMLVVGCPLTDSN